MHENQLERKETTLENRLEKMIEEKSENEDDGFKKEYHTLLCGPRYPFEIGKRQENIKKNRFKSTVAYDHSRVILDAKCPDYINANYIDGVRQEKVYIATQGPRKNTVSDFWSMVWHERVKQVVMLTNVMEGVKAKCFQYWPELETDANFDIFTIKTVDERHYAYYVIRKLNVTHTTINENRVVTKYHYTAWPDHDTPDPLCLLLFHNHVTRTKVARHKVPTLVHCSAGIGRTGTYIAIDALHEEGQCQSKINIAEYVRKMREKRINMVQTYEQYKTIFLTLNEMFKAPVGVQTAINFQKSLQLAKRDHHAFVSTVNKEFQLLSIRHCYSENDYKMALTPASMSNRALGPSTDSTKMTFLFGVLLLLLEQFSKELKRGKVIVVLFISTAIEAKPKNEQQNNGIGHICEKSNPCENDAPCGYTRGGYICKCPAGWKGDDCDEDIDECVNSPCGLGSCTNTDSSYKCTCPAGLTGTYCEQDVDECKPNPCKNGATCTNTRGSFTCTCNPGWTGSLCDQDIIECDTNPCKNGGSCKNNDGSFTCSCNVGWTGTLCDVVIETVIVCRLGRMELRCPAGVIKIEKALWGRTEGSAVCPDSERKTKPPCISTQSDAVVRGKCDGNARCSIAVNSNALGGNPCPGTAKYLEVRFTCVVV